MKDWKTSTLGELTTFLGRGKSPVYADENDVNTMPVLNQACVQNGRLDLGKLKSVTKRFWDSLPDERRLQKGDVLINSTGTGTLGRLGFWKGALEAAFDGHVTVLRFPEEHCSQFFYHLLSTETCRSIIEGECTSGSTNQVELLREQLRRMVLKHPVHKDTQATIAETLSMLDNAIEQTEALLAKQQRIKTGLMHDLLTRGLDAQGRLRDPSTHRFKKSPLGLIPEEWEVAIVASLCSVIVDCPHTTPRYEDDGIPCIRTADMLPGVLMLDRAFRVSLHTYQDRIARLRPEIGDIIYSREGERLGIASPVGNETVCLGQRVMLLRPTPDTNPTFLMWAMNSPDFYNRVTRDQIATTSPHVNVRDIKVSLVATPSSREQKLIGAALASDDAAASKLVTQLTKHRRLKTGLMHDLLTGRVAVTPLLGGKKGQAKD